MFSSPPCAFFLLFHLNFFSLLVHIFCVFPFSFFLMPCIILFLLLSGLWNPWKRCVHLSSFWWILSGQAMLRAILGPPPSRCPGDGGVPVAAKTHASELISKAWCWSWTYGVEPPHSGATRLPQAEHVHPQGSGLRGWPEQQVGEAEHLWIAGCDSPFKTGHQTPAGSGFKQGFTVASHTLLNTADEAEKWSQHFHRQSPDFSYVWSDCIFAAPFALLFVLFWMLSFSLILYMWTQIHTFLSF